jgi:hypothetical protein
VAMKPLVENRVEVDMVPMIDIVTLLLMFLIIVGDMTAVAGNVQMKLPRADQAQKDGKGTRDEGRIVIQLQEQKGVYRAIVNNKSYELIADGGNGTLIRYLEDHINGCIARHEYVREQSGAVPTPVKLRIPADAPMRDAEKVVMTLARIGLVNIRYAAEPEKKTK